jgi:hypothetical protein
MSCTGIPCCPHPYNSTVTADVKQKFIKPKKFFWKSVDLEKKCGII